MDNIACEALAEALCQLVYEQILKPAKKVALLSIGKNETGGWFVTIRNVSTSDAIAADISTGYHEVVLQ